MGDIEPAETEVSRRIGFLPSYSPDSANTESDTSTREVVPPPYQSGLLSCDQNPPPYSPGLSGCRQISTLSYDPVGSSYNAEPPPYPSESTDEDGINFPQTKEFQRTIPSAPSIDQIEYRIGLTQTERHVILNALSKMRANALWKSQKEKKNFSRAEDEVLELLHSVESRLTNSEKEEFLIEVRKINQMRDEEENFADNISLERFNDSVTIVLKILEVTMSFVIFVNIKEPKLSLDRRLTLLFFELIGILSTCFLTSYWCNPYQSRNVDILDSTFCVVGAIGCGLAGCFASEPYWTGIFAFCAMSTYGLDILWKLLQKTHSQ